MFKFIVFTIFLVASPAFGLIENLYDAMNDCYLGCHKNYAMSLFDVYACKSGCNYKLYNENCADRCQLLPIDEQTRASCVVGCSMNQFKPHVITPLRLRPSMDMSDEESDETTTPANLLSISNKIKTIFRLTNLLNNTNNNTRIIKHFLVPQHDILQSTTQQYANSLHDKLNNLGHKQSNIALWILLTIFILSSIIICCMIISLCRRRSQYHALSIRSQECMFDNTYEKEKIQPNEHYYDLTQSVPIKVKLGNM